MFKKYKNLSIEDLDKMGYVIYKNNKFTITKKYNKYGKKNYLKEIIDCFLMLITGIGLIIGFPFCLIYTLFSFIPSIDIIDKENEDD